MLLRVSFRAGEQGNAGRSPFREPAGTMRDKDALLSAEVSPASNPHKSRAHSLRALSQVKRT